MKRIATCIIAVCLMCLISLIYATTAANGFLWARTKAITTELSRGEVAALPSAALLPIAPTIFPTDERKDIPSDEPASPMEEIVSAPPEKEYESDEQPNASTPSDLITDEQTTPVEGNNEDSEEKD